MSAKLTVNVVSESAFTTQGHGVHTAFIETINGLRARDDVTVLVNSRKRADVIHIHTVGPYSLGKLLFSRGKKVVSAHVTPDSFVGSLIAAKYWYLPAKWYLRWFYNRANAVLAVSGEVVEELKHIGVKRRIELMPNTIDTKRYLPTSAHRADSRQALGIKDDQFVVIGVGQVQPRKGINVFADVANSLPEMRFIWVGGMPFKRLAASHAEMGRIMEHPGPNLSFTGVINQEETLKYYWAADAFLLPSYQETFGIVIVEAAAAGLPVVLRDLDQYRTTFSGGYITGDDKSFAPTIKKLSLNGEYYQEWVKKGHTIADHYDSVAGSQRLVDVYHSLS
jgi:1,2-diacylglycerol-3-alpha-glucose alpha-1,2-galactosyltransferase